MKNFTRRFFAYATESIQHDPHPRWVGWVVVPTMLVVLGAGIVALAR